MSGRELAEARENDEREWREDGAARALADLPAVCPACEGTGYTDGVTVRHPCVLCVDGAYFAFEEKHPYITPHKSEYFKAGWQAARASYQDAAAPEMETLLRDLVVSVTADRVNAIAAAAAALLASIDQEKPQ